MNRLRARHIRKFIEPLLCLSLIVSLSTSLSSPGFAQDKEEVKEKVKTKVKSKVEDAKKKAASKKPKDQKDAEKKFEDLKNQAKDKMDEDIAPDTKKAKKDNSEKHKRPDPVPQGITAGMSLGIIHADGGEGHIRSRGGADLTLHYDLDYVSGFDTYLSARYSAFDVSLEDNAYSFRGVIQGYHFGTGMILPISKRLSGFTGIELGLLFSQFYSIDHQKDSDEYDLSGAHLSVLGGLRYQISDTTRAITEAKFGFGTYQISQLSFGFEVDL